MHRKHIKKRSETLTQTLRNSNHQNHKNHWKTQGKSIKLKKLQVRILLRKLKTYIRFSIIVCIIFSSFSGRNFNMFSMIFGIKKQWKIAMFLDSVFLLILDPFCTHFELILGGFWEPKPVILGIYFLIIFACRPKSGPRAPKSGPRAAQERPKSAQERPKSGQEVPKSGPRVPKSDLRAAQERPRATQKQPRAAQERPRAARE